MMMASGLAYSTKLAKLTHFSIPVRALAFSTSVLQFLPLGGRESADWPVDVSVLLKHSVLIGSGGHCAGSWFAAETGLGGVLCDVGQKINGDVLDSCELVLYLYESRGLSAVPCGCEVPANLESTLTFVS